MLELNKKKKKKKKKQIDIETLLHQPQVYTFIYTSKRFLRGLHVPKFYSLSPSLSLSLSLSAVPNTPHRKPLPLNRPPRLRLKSRPSRLLALLPRARQQAQLPPYQLQLYSSMTLNSQRKRKGEDR